MHTARRGYPDILLILVLGAVAACAGMFLVGALAEIPLHDDAERRWPALIAVHTIAACYGLIFGAMQLIRRRRGDMIHRVIGWTWTAAMAVALSTSMFIQTLDGFLFWFLHGLTVFTAITITIAIVQARRGRIASHRAFMVGSYLGLLGAFAGVVAVPARRFDQTLLTQPLIFSLWAVIIVATAFATALGIRWRSLSQGSAAGRNMAADR